jgi:hypothetical protein
MFGREKGKRIAVVLYSCRTYIARSCDPLGLSNWDDFISGSFPARTHFYTVFEQEN